MKTESTKARGGKYIRLGSLLLMLIFTVCAFTLMWTAVSSFRKIRSGYENASESLAAARFIANHLRSAAGKTDVYSLPDGTLDRIVINNNSGYENVITFRNGRLYEAFVHEGMNSSVGEEMFPVGKVFLELSDAGAVRITADSGSGQANVIYAEPAGEILFCPSEGGSR